MNVQLIFEIQWATEMGWKMNQSITGNHLLKVYFCWDNSNCYTFRCSSETHRRKNQLCLAAAVATLKCEWEIESEWILNKWQRQLRRQVAKKKKELRAIINRMMQDSKSSRYFSFYDLYPKQPCTFDSCLLKSLVMRKCARTRNLISILSSERCLFKN